jgi:hypothetical protein
LLWEDRDQGCKMVVQAHPLSNTECDAIPGWESGVSSIALLVAFSPFPRVLGLAYHFLPKGYHRVPKLRKALSPTQYLQHPIFILKGSKP